MTAPFRPRLPAPTRCPHCNHMPLCAEAICKWCGKSRIDPVAQPAERPADRVVGVASVLIAAFCVATGVMP